LPWRDDDTGDGIEPREGWGDDFHAGVKIIHTSPYNYTYSIRQATTSGRWTTREVVELSTSTYPDDDRYGLPDNEHLSTSDDESVLELCLDLARFDEVLDRCFPQGFFIDHGNIEFDEQWWRRQLWQDDDDSHDWWREESCIDSTPDAVSELHDGSCLEQDSVCSNSNSDADTDTDYDANTDTDTSGWTTEQPGSSDGVSDDSDSISSITTEELLAWQPDSETEVSTAHEQSSHELYGGDGTSGTPSWSTAGFRFLPSDRDIVLYYLKRKVLNRRLPVYHTIEERHDIYALDADEITRKFRTYISAICALG
jgi:hypothetical protein